MTVTSDHVREEGGTALTEPSQAPEEAVGGVGGFVRESFASQRAEEVLTTANSKAAALGGVWGPSAQPRFWLEQIVNSPGSSELSLAGT